MKGLNDSVAKLNNIALKLVKQNVNSACFWISHQPKVPDAAKKFRKF
ncbi:cyclic lactone autoinducer peptide [Anaeromicropila herbilytica]|uniref:Cyclic lactone autoinducer peptide n=1 Tax=Anaeromicropila herbilytica TaxID=2785025 RepID=A0A7R7EIR4_9FIRM|nr:cyclic lactone autoinducer peptide [Anaeromicropila herbilytica]BCN29465.1 hypothetical protein bsdtb5_07600 [Anaeromicropila herbilytica]